MSAEEKLMPVGEKTQRALHEYLQDACGGTVLHQEVVGELRRSIKNMQSQGAHGIARVLSRVLRVLDAAYDEMRML